MKKIPKSQCEKCGVSTGTGRAVCAWWTKDFEKIKAHSCKSNVCKECAHSYAGLYWCPEHYAALKERIGEASSPC